MAVRSTARYVPRKVLGERMQHWHSSGSDPIYAVGSFYFAGKQYPTRNVVEAALTRIVADIPAADAGMHGWTKRDANELRLIARGLRYYLKRDYATQTHASRTRSTRFGNAGAQRNSFAIGQRVAKTMGVRLNGIVIRPFNWRAATDGTYKAPDRDATWVRWDDGTRGWIHSRFLKAAR